MHKPLLKCRLVDDLHSKQESNLRDHLPFNPCSVECSLGVNSTKLDRSLSKVFPFIWCTCEFLGAFSKTLCSYSHTFGWATFTTQYTKLSEEVCFLFVPKGNRASSPTFLAAAFLFAILIEDFIFEVEDFIISIVFYQILQELFKVKFF